MRTLLLLLLAVPAVAADPVCIAVRSRPTGTDAIITVGQAAALTGGSEAAREKMAKLDLIERPEAEAISRRLIRYRLRLAGFEDADFTFGDGPQQQPAAIVPARGVTLSAEAVEEAAKAELARRFGKSPDEVFIDVLLPVGAKLPAAGPDDAVELAAVPAGGGVIKLGRTQMTVTVKVNGERKAQVPVVLNASEVRAEGGKVPAVPAVVAIKARQPVEMTVRVGDLVVKDLGEATHEAKLGEPIKVKNSRTGKVVSGIVAGPGAVDIPVGDAR